MREYFLFSITKKKKPIDNTGAIPYDQRKKMHAV